MCHEKKQKTDWFMPHSFFDPSVMSTFCFKFKKIVTVEPQDSFPNKCLQFLTLSIPPPTQPHSVIEKSFKSKCLQAMFNMCHAIEWHMNSGLCQPEPKRCVGQTTNLHVVDFLWNFLALGTTHFWCIMKSSLDRINLLTSTNVANQINVKQRNAKSWNDDRQKNGKCVCKSKWKLWTSGDERSKTAKWKPKWITQV